ncbi:hypothetical protein [uncultured Clostridium sp.]|uniref:hypothetical protein n=1 Tax=uncultured Clostridium sp. TaxID=59620 RepID=UPI0025F37A1E|nr:hypothetical protein [uncultured Clostridium sp.]
MRLEFATNEMINIFDNNLKFVILKKAVCEIRNKLIKEEIAVKIEALNTLYKAVIYICNDYNDNIEDSMLNNKEFVLYAFEMYQNVISTIVFIRNTKINFKKIYKEKYVQVFRTDVLNFWNELTVNNKTSSNNRTFIKMFDEIHDYALKNNQDLFSKNISSLKVLVRGVKDSCLGNYDRMIPKDEYAGFNRWNPKGKAFLYLGYAENESKDSINNSIETCCEELRMRNGERVTICRFKPVKSSGKLLDFTIDEDIVGIEEDILNESFDNDLEKILSNEKLIEEGKRLKQSGEKRKLKRLIKTKINNKADRKKIERYISTMFIHNIVESIFLPIEEDKDSYLPFHLFANYLIEKGYCGVINKSTRMDLIKKKGKNVIFFNPLDAEPCEGTMRLLTKDGNVIIEEKK